MKERILFLASHFISLYSTRRELITELAERGYDIYISIPESEDNVYFENLGCKIVPTKVERRGTNPFKDIFVMFRYRRIIRRLKPDIILSYEIKPNIYGAMGNKFLTMPGSKRKYPQICNITGTGATFLQEDFINKLCKFLYKISIGRSAHLIYFQNAQDRDFFVSHKMVGGNIELLPGSGVNLNQFTPKPMPADDEVKFIFIARVMRLKGIYEYLYAAEKIKEEYPNTKFYIAGFTEGEEYLRLVEEYENKGIIEYLGFRSDITDCIEMCHCTVLPSHGGEGVPNVLLESAAMARPCIGSRIPGTLDVIDEGVTGYLFDAKDADGLVEALRKFMELSYDEKVQMGQRGRERMEKQFDRNIVINKYLNEIEKLEKVRNKEKEKKAKKAKKAK